MSDPQTLLYEESDGVAWVTLNRPAAYNAFDSVMQSELRDLWSMLRTGVLDLSGLDITLVGLDDPQAALAAAARTRGLRIVVLMP